jgi:hypothetical protein
MEKPEHHGNFTPFLIYSFTVFFAVVFWCFMKMTTENDDLRGHFVFFFLNHTPHATAKKR